MFRQFQKGEFLIRCNEQATGSIVSVMSTETPIGTSTGNIQLGLVKPGNLYMLSHSKWILLDSGSITQGHQYKDHNERASEALAIAITRLPIGYKLLSLTPGECKLIAAVVYDISTGSSLNWLITAETYLLEKGEMIAVSGLNRVTYSLPNNVENIREAFKKPLTTSVKTDAPTMVIDPPALPKPRKSDKSESPPSQSGSVLAPLVMIQEGDHVSKYPDFYAFVERRSQWKRDHPNWREESNTK